jgi:predicted metal-dependent enzyme (double-stranded beta helix superfamily)
MRGLGLFRDFIREITQLVDGQLDEAQLLTHARPLMQDLMRNDTWLPDRYAAANPDRYQQYLLHCDSLERFSVVSFVWGPGQETPIHDHTVWGLLGVLRGSEVSQRYVAGDGTMYPSGPLEILESGATDMVSPTLGDIHKVQNGSRSAPSVSIHLYGGNIGALHRHTFAQDGGVKTFRSGYSLDTMPNIWSV